MPLVLLYVSAYCFLGVVIDLPSEFQYGQSSYQISLWDIVVGSVFVALFLLICIGPSIILVSLRPTDLVLDEICGRHICLYIFLSVVGLIASMANAFLVLPLSLEQISSLSCTLSLFSFGYGFFLLIHGEIRTQFRRVLILIGISLGFISYFLLPLFLGSITKPMLLIISLIGLLILTTSKYVRLAVVGFLLLLLIAVAVIQSIKGEYREQMFGGHYSKYIHLDENKKSCQINSNLIAPSYPKTDLNAIVSQSQILDAYERGWLRADLQEINSKVSRLYSQKHLLELEALEAVSRELAGKKNFILQLALVRALGVGEIPRDATRAARLAAMGQALEPKLSQGIWGLLESQSWGLQGDIENGVACVLESEHPEIIGYLNRIARGDVKLYMRKYMKGTLWLERIDGKTLTDQGFFSNQNIPPLHDELHAFLRPLDKRSNYILSSVSDRLDVSRLLFLVRARFYDDPRMSFSDYSDLPWALVPRLVYPKKPVFRDMRGILVGKILGLDGRTRSNFSWAIPVVPESIMAGGILGLILVAGFFSLCITFLVYQSTKDFFRLFLYGSIITANLGFSIIAGIGILSGFVQAIVIGYLICFMRDKLIS